MLFAQKEYIIKQHVPKEIFEAYLNYLNDVDMSIQINSDNYFYFKKLDDELQIMKEYLSKQKFVDIEKISFTKQFSTDENTDKSPSEKFISENLDYYLDNYENEMFTIPINSLSNIFYYEKRNLIDHGKAYQFINKYKKMNNDNNLNIDFLIATLQDSKLSNEQFINSLVNKDNHSGFIPKTNFSFLENLNKNISEIRFQCEQSLDKIMKIVKAQQDQIKQIQFSIMYLQMNGNINNDLVNGSSEICKILKNQVDKGEITQINLPMFLTTIPANQFLNCKNLEKVEIPPTVHSIAQSAFDDCSALEEIIIPPFLMSIDNYAFRKCSSLKYFVIPNFLKSIGQYAFAECSSITELTIPYSVNSIGNYAFLNCTSLVKIELLFTGKTINDFVFCGCSSLKKIVIPSSVTSIGHGTFQDCVSLKEIVIPSSVTSIGVNAFQNCVSLIEINFPSSLTTIEQEAFLNCSLLKEVYIPSSVSTLNQNAFKGCTSLTHVKIPTSLVSKAAAAFPLDGIQINNY